jgi:urease accessory protein UreF
MLSTEQITKFQTLYKNRFGKEISREEAYEKGAKLIRLVEIVYKPMTEDEYQKLQERRKETGDLKN